MAWKIVKDANILRGQRYLVKDEDGMTKGEIITLDDAKWEVNLMMVPDLQFKHHDLERCIGYVRGVEATVNLYAKETGRDKRRA